MLNIDLIDKWKAVVTNESFQDERSKLNFKKTSDQALSNFFDLYNFTEEQKTQVSEHPDIIYVSLALEIEVAYFIDLVNMYRNKGIEDEEIEKKDNVKYLRLDLLKDLLDYLKIEYVE